MTQVLVMRPDDVRSFGSNAALLIGQMEFWLFKAKIGRGYFLVERAGHTWVAKPRSEILEEIGLTLKQGKTAISKLLKAGVLVSEMHLVNCVTRPHYRLNMEVLGTSRSVPKGTSHGRSQKGPTDWGQKGPTLYSSESVLERQRELATASQSRDEVSGQGFQGENEMGRRPKSSIGGGTVADVMAGSRRAVAAPVSVCDVSKPSHLEAVFKAAWDAAYPGKYRPNMSAVELGKLKHLITRCPAGGAGAVVDYAVRNWPVIISAAKEYEGAFNTPTLPSVGFLLQYLQTAVQCSAEAGAGGDAPGSTTANAKPGYAFKVPPSQKNNLEPEPVEMVTDLEELAKLLGLGQ